MRDESVLTLHGFDPPEYRRLTNLLVDVAKSATWDIENNISPIDNTRRYKDAVILLNQLGISEQEVQDEAK